MEILKDPRNYDHKRKPVVNVGKLCDAEVDTEAFWLGLATLG